MELATAAGFKDIKYECFVCKYFLGYGVHQVGKLYISNIIYLMYVCALGVRDKNGILQNDLRERSDAISYFLKKIKIKIIKVQTYKYKRRFIYLFILNKIYEN